MIVIFLLTTVVDPAPAKEKIVWPYICYFPIAICDGDSLKGGYEHSVFELIRDNMPEYEFELRLEPLKRTLNDMKKGTHNLCYGLYKTPEREKFLVYSLPCRLGTPSAIVVRKEDLNRFGGGKSVSLGNLLRNSKLKFLTFHSISFGVTLDELINRYKNASHVHMDYRTDEVDAYLIDLLLKDRIDYSMTFNGTPYIANKLGLADKVAFINLTEAPEYKTGHITAPKNEWGVKVIKKINQLLKREVPTDQFYQFFKPYVGLNLEPEYRKQFKKLLVDPAQRYSPPRNAADN